MKNYPLSFQIWIIIVVITLAITVLLAFILPTTLRSFFTNEIYETIDSAQNALLNQFEVNNISQDILPADRLHDIRTVRHILIYDRSQVFLNTPITVEFLNQVKEEISMQKNPTQRYSGSINDEKVFYIIRKGNAYGRELSLVSYMGDAYREDLVDTLFRRLISIMVIILMFSWIPAILLSRHLSRPLINLENRVHRLANKEWNEPIEINRKDEIGRLGKSIEELRTQLIRQDQAEQSFLQNVSHELKTPVMVIRSFAQAIKDGIYPKGDLNNSVEIIDNEAERLEKKIKNLLYLTKLDYMENHNTDYSSFSLDSLIKDVVDRMDWSRKDLDWNLNLTPINISGDMEQWKIVIENLVDNQIRYAESQISITLDKDKSQLKIWNDGPHMEDELLNNLFKEFNKGYKGEFGLGLSIVKKILDIHNSTIDAKNEDIGVSFIINFNSINQK